MVAKGSTVRYQLEAPHATAGPVARGSINEIGAKSPEVSMHRFLRINGCSNPTTLNDFSHSDWQRWSPNSASKRLRITSADTANSNSLFNEADKQTEAPPTTVQQFE